MKKYINIIFVFIMLLFIPLNVNAENTCDVSKVTVKSIEMIHKSNNVVESSSPEVDSNSLSMDIKMDEVNDFITYKIVINNNTNEDFKLNTKSITLNSNYLEYNLEFENDPVIKKNEDNVVLLKVKYNKEIPSSAFVNGMFNADENTSLYLANGRILNVPNTLSDNPLIMILIYIVSFVIIVGLTIVVLKHRDAKKYYVLIILPFILIPISAKADCMYTVDINTKMSVKEKVAIFDTGVVVNTKLKALAGDDNPTIDTENNSIIHIVRSTNKPDISSMNETNIVSSAESDIKIYAWFDTDTIYYYSDYAKPFINVDGSSMFKFFKQVTDIDIVNTNMYRTENLNDFFNGCVKLLEVNLNHNGGPNLLSFYGFILNCNQLKKFDMSYFDFGKIKSFTTTDSFYGNSHFRYMSNLEEINLSHSNMNSIEYAQYMFEDLYGVNKIDISYLQMENASTVHHFFADSNVTELIIHHASFKNVPDLSYMFKNLDVTELDFTGVNFLGAKDMNHLLRGCSSLKVADLRGLVANENGEKTPLVESMSEMIMYGSSLEYVYLDGLGSDYLKRANLFYSDSPNLKVISLKNFNFGTEESNTFSLTNDYENLELLDLSGADFSKSIGRPGNSTVKSNKYVFNCENMKARRNMTYFFYYSTAKEIKLKGADFSKVVIANTMFQHLSNITELDLSGLDFSSVTDASYMFAWNPVLQKVNLKDVEFSSLTNMMRMFCECPELTEIDLSGADTSKVTNFDYLFYNDYKLKKINVSNFVIKDGANLQYAFAFCGDTSDKLEFIGLSTWKFLGNANLLATFYSVGNSSSELSFGNLSTWTIGPNSNIKLMLASIDATNVVDIGSLRLSSQTLESLFAASSSIKGRVIIDGVSSNYDNMFSNAAYHEGTSIVVDYTSNVSSNMDYLNSLINTKHYDLSNVVLGDLVD